MGVASVVGGARIAGSMKQVTAPLFCRRSVHSVATGISDVASRFSKLDFRPKRTSPRRAKLLFPRFRNAKHHLFARTCSLTSKTGEPLSRRQDVPAGCGFLRLRRGEDPGVAGRDPQEVAQGRHRPVEDVEEDLVRGEEFAGKRRGNIAAEPRREQEDVRPGAPGCGAVADRVRVAAVRVRRLRLGRGQVAVAAPVREFRGREPGLDGGAEGDAEAQEAPGRQGRAPGVVGGQRALEGCRVHG